MSSSPIALRIITKISGTDPDKECQVTLSQKSKKDIVIGIYERILEEYDADDVELEEYYETQLQAWREWDEHDDPPGIGEVPYDFDPAQDFTGAGQDFVAIDVSSSYDFHYAVEDVVWDPTKNLKIAINEH